MPWSGNRRAPISASGFSNEGLLDEGEYYSKVVRPATLQFWRTWLLCLQHVPVAPSKRIEIEVPASLDHVIMACLAKAPLHRPAGADVFASLLESCDDLGSWTPRDAEHWWHTNMAADVVHADDPAPPMHRDPAALTTLCHATVPLEVECKCQRKRTVDRLNPRASVTPLFNQQTLRGLVFVLRQE
jgi:hypothetical protein